MISLLSPPKMTRYFSLRLWLLAGDSMRDFQTWPPICNVNHQQLPILPQEYVVEWLIDRECPPFLLLAISALSLPYSSHHSLKSDWDVDLADRLNQQSRMELQKHSFSKSNLDKIVAMCILALHEINFGNGEQAWCDVELMPAIDDTNSMESVVFSTIKNQLAWIRVCFALGHPNLLPCIHRKPEDKINEEILGADACVAGAVKLILDIAKYTDKHPDLDTMPPWYQQSTFMSLHRQLDRFFIYIAANFHIGAGSPLDGVSSRAEYFYALFVNLVLEHCTMMLTQGVLAQLEEGKKGHWDGAPPSTFIEACALACETSAENIYEICVILASERLSILPPFLGFCCFQAAMIFIYCLPKKEGRARGEIVAKLKLILAVLGAIKTAYKGASLWIIAKDNSTSLQRDGDLAGAEAHGNNEVEQASHESNDESPPQSDGLEQNFTSRISLPPTFPHQVLWGDQEVNSHTNPAYGLEGIVASFYHLAHEAGIPIMSDEEYLRMGSHIADQVKKVRAGFMDSGLQLLYLAYEGG
ncbi:hypothetical protein GQ53DRAFT_766458 [Thozetella sp. PMI_491]|nr:hypothetical protein GQ53DRAFT_766458 [Thozetella sp. PMI_491]